jgi:hypothetical protein
MGKTLLRAIIFINRRAFLGEAEHWTAKSLVQDFSQNLFRAYARGFAMASIVYWASVEMRRPADAKELMTAFFAIGLLIGFCSQLAALGLQDVLGEALEGAMAMDLEGARLFDTEIQRLTGQAEGGSWKGGPGLSVVRQRELGMPPLPQPKASLGESAKPAKVLGFPRPPKRP